VTVDVLTETLIDCPVDAVAAFAGDPSNAPRWYVHIDSVEWLSPPPLGRMRRANRSDLAALKALLEAGELDDSPSSPADAALQTQLVTHLPGDGVPPGRQLRGIRLHRHQQGVAGSRELFAHDRGPAEPIHLVTCSLELLQQDSEGSASGWLRDERVGGHRMTSVPSRFGAVPAVRLPSTVARGARNRPAIT
jgi:hypothetical protein